MATTSASVYGIRTDCGMTARILLMSGKTGCCASLRRLDQRPLRIGGRHNALADELTTLVHCAGILRRTGLLFSDGEEADLDDLWRVNVMGPWWLTRAAWSSLSASGEGRIQVLVSMSGKRSKGRMAGYPVSKFALMALCQTMRNEGWDVGIRVTAFCPSWVNTEMATSISWVAPEAMTQPQDLASLSSTLLQLPNAAVPFD